MNVYACLVGKLALLGENQKYVLAVLWSSDGSLIWTDNAPQSRSDDRDFVDQPHRKAMRVEVGSPQGTGTRGEIHLFAVVVEEKAQVLACGKIFYAALVASGGALLAFLHVVPRTADGGSFVCPFHEDV